MPSMRNQAQVWFNMDYALNDRLQQQLRELTQASQSLTRVVIGNVEQDGNVEQEEGVGMDFDVAVEHIVRYYLEMEEGYYLDRSNDTLLRSHIEGDTGEFVRSTLLNMDDEQWERIGWRIYPNGDRGITYVRLYRSGAYITAGNPSGFMLNVNERHYGAGVRDIIRPDSSLVPVAEAKSILVAALPPWVRVRSVKAWLKFETDRSGIFREAIADFPGVRTTGSGAERSVAQWRLDQTLRRVESLMPQIRALFRERMKQRIMESTAPSKPVRSGGGDLSKFMDGRSRLTSEVDVIQSLPIPRTGVKASRSWGMEIEVASAYGVVRPPGWGKKGDGSLFSGYNEHKRGANLNVSGDGHARDEDFHGSWNPEGCAVCKMAYSEYLDGAPESREFVSPILMSFHSAGVRSITSQAVLQPQNTSAGVHVHVDAGDLTVRQVGSLVYGYSVIEPLIEASYRRETRTYCQTRELSELRQIGQSVKELLREGQYSDLTSIYQGDRYVSLNLWALEAHGTVEFRAMGPRYDYDTLIRWASFCREMVNVAKAGVKFSEWNAIDSFDKLRQLFIVKGSETAENALSTIDEGMLTDLFAVNDNIRWQEDGARLVMSGGEI